MCVRDSPWHATHYIVCVCACTYMCRCSVDVGPGHGTKILVWFDMTAPARSPKDYFLSAQNKNNLDIFCTEINSPDNKIQRIKPLLLKYSVVKSKKTRLPLCALMLVFETFLLFSLFNVPYFANFGICITSIKLRWWTTQLVSATFGNFFKNTFGSRSW